MIIIDQTSIKRINFKFYTAFFKYELQDQIVTDLKELYIL